MEGGAGPMEGGEFQRIGECGEWHAAGSLEAAPGFFPPRLAQRMAAPGVECSSVEPAGARMEKRYVEPRVGIRGDGAVGGTTGPPGGC